MAPTKQSVLITGCTTGSAGHALALEFASRGWRVFATARSVTSLAGLEEKSIELLSLDISSPESIAALKNEIAVRTGGKLDALFNNAGQMYEAPAIEADAKRVRQMFDVNVFGVFDMVAAFTPLVLAAVSGSSHPPIIVNTAYVLAVVPYPFSSAYNATKAAIASYSDTLRVELAPLGIKVVTLYMGVVSTGISIPAGIRFDENSIYADLEAGVKERSRSHQASGMKPDKFAAEVVSQVLKRRGLGQGEYIWKGNNALLIRILSTVGGRKVFDSSNASEIGFTDEVKQSVAQKSRATL